MDCQKKKKRKIHPRENSNLLSIIFFRYVFDTVRTGARRDLNDDDIYKVLKKYRSDRLCERLEKEWNKELKKTNPSILKAFLRLFFVEYSLWLIGIFLTSLLTENIIIPLMTGKLMTYFQPGQNVTKTEAFSYAITIVVSSLTLTLYDNTCLFSVLAIGLKLRTACSALIYKKCLKLNLNANPEFDSGKAVTLITKDVTQFADAAHFGHILILILPRTFIVTSVMYRAIGAAALVGAGFLVGLLPILVLCGKLTSYYRLRTAGKTDQRVKLTQEIFTTIRIIKMYAWEQFFSNCVNKLRLKEIKNLKILFYVKALAYSIGEVGARFAFYVCVITYISLGNYVTAQKAFIVVSTFGTLGTIFTNNMPLGIAQMAELQASLHRITNFLMLEEISGVCAVDCKRSSTGKISVNNATVKTTNNVVVLKNVNLNINKGLTIITGATGAGKSTLLKLFLGEITKGDGKIDVYGSFSYASEEPWLFPGTVRQNILFGENFDQRRYDQVIEACALRKDLGSFPNGDSTLITDKGLNLSKGQKARINLARAVYRQADIYLIDDGFSSVDGSVCHHIFNECIKKFLRERSCILVTNNTNLTKYADRVLVVENGNVRYVDEFECKSDLEALETVGEGNSQMRTDTQTITHYEATPSVRPLYEETKETGVVKKTVYYDYFMSAGGFKMILLVLVWAIAAQATASWTDYFVSFWVDIEQELSEFRINRTTNSFEYRRLEDSHNYTIKLYSVVILLTAFCTFSRSFVWFLFSSRASINIHNSVLSKLLKTGITFFDTHLCGNVLNRFSRDFGIVDEQLPLTAFTCLRIFLQLIGIFAVVSSVNVYFIIPSCVFMIILFFGRRYYIPTGRNLRRLEGAARSPVIGYLSTTIEGLVTARAHGAEAILRNEFNKHQDHYTSALFMNLSTTYGFGLYLDLTGVLYVIIIILTFLYLQTDVQAGKIGLALTQSLSMKGLLQWGVRVWSDLENHMTSTERILEYEDIIPESKRGSIIENWPNKGAISYKNVNLSYPPHNEKILTHINFTIEPKEKIGIVGRTGAGKTSIISTLFRMHNFDGLVTIDDVDITLPSITLLRSKISVIPQDPVIFSGTVRTNLDPYLDYTDDVLWNALEEVKMKKYITALDDVVNEGGINFSAGQKQLICFARAIIRDNVVLILDEATANIDAEIDSIIQNIIKKKFVDCTVITIAHKLSTVLDSDKVLVMDSGEVIQFGPPDELLKHESKLFYEMLKVSGLLLSTNSSS